jgi:hypothetical protein
MCVLPRASKPLLNPLSYDDFVQKCAIGAGIPEDDKPGILEYAFELDSRSKKVRSGNLGEASDLLIAQSPSTALSPRPPGARETTWTLGIWRHSRSTCGWR